MNMDISQINWFAVLVAGLVTFFIGGAWYTVLFGNVWLKHSKYSPEQKAGMEAARPKPVYFGMLVVSYLVIAFIVALLVQATGVKSVGSALCLGTLLWVIAAAIDWTAHISSPKSIGAYLVDAGYQLIYLPLMAVILTMWR